MTTLTELSLKHNTDKNPNDHNYVFMYEDLLATRYINNMLEIGLGSGASAKMWCEYYPNSNIHIMEFFDKEHKETWKSPEISIPNMIMHRGDSTKMDSWVDIPYGLDLIIDDGSHHPNDQIATFENGFSHLRSHGLYVIEDTHCNFEKIYTDGQDIIYNWALNMVFNQQMPQAGNTNGNFYQLRGMMPMPIRDIFSYRFYKSVIVFEKA